jgi:hypothetical protein
MPQTPSAAGSGSRRTGSAAGPPVASAATNRSKSRLTIRLPDVSAPREPPRAESNSVDPASEAARPAGPSPRAGPSQLKAAIGAALPATISQIGKPLSHPIVGKVVAFVRQPKFWLACIAAIAVQVVLAAVMTPAKDDRDQPERPRTAAIRWSKPVSTPAARIVVPPAQTPNEDTEPANNPKTGTTTPLGVTAPLETSSDADGSNGQALSGTDASGLLTPPTRMADNRRLAGDARPLDGRSAGPIEGATLRGIVPLEPGPEPNSHEQP